jgi:hypothetical protein
MKDLIQKYSKAAETAQEKGDIKSMLRSVECITLLRGGRVKRGNIRYKLKEIKK